MEVNDNLVCVPELLLLKEVSELAAASTNLDNLLQTILEKTMTAIGGNRGFIAMVDFDSGQLDTRYTAGEGWDEERKKQRLELHTGDGRGITTYVGATGKPYKTGDITKDPYYIPSFKDVKSELAVPIIDAYRRTRGVINIESPKPDAFDERHVVLAQALANLASLGISIDEHRNRERAFVEIGSELARSTDIQSLVSKVVRVAAEVLRFEDCSLFFYDKDRNILTLVASYGHLSADVGTAVYRLGEGLTGWIAEHGQPIRTSNPKEDPRWLGLHPEFSSEELSAFLGVPIESQEGVIGVLRVVRKKSKFPWFQNEFTEEDERVLMGIATQIGAAIESIRLMDRVVNAERMAAWGEMSARSAHMMGNRVFAIKGDLNELEYQIGQLTESDVKKNLQNLVDSIKKGVYRLEEILTEFRDFVLATQLSLAENDINTIIKQVVDETFPKRSNVRLELNLTSELPKVMVDPQKLKRSFSELIENSISFQKEGGFLRISTSLATPKEARDLCGLSTKREYIRIEFADAGPGIPEADKEKIFNPFFTSRAKGMGLGLSIVKGIIEAHHGKICEIGTPGQGARFVIFLPAVEGSQDQSK